MSWGDNTAALRASITGDELLRSALANDDVACLVLGHTRWASVGIISQANAHPQNATEVGVDSPVVTAVLNGDVDNFADLISDEQLTISPRITTDAKVIPAVMARRLADGASGPDAFRDTVGLLDGSVAIAANAAGACRPAAPGAAGEWPGPVRRFGRGRLRGGVGAVRRGGGDRPLPAHGRRDACTNPENPVASRGQVIELSAEGAGTIEGIGRWAYDGTALALTEDSLSRAEITTRDIDRGDYPHLPPEGDLARRRRALRKTTARHASSRRTAVLRASASAISELPRRDRCARGLRDGAIQRIMRHRPGHGRRGGPRCRWRHAPRGTRRPTRRSGSRRCPRRSCQRFLTCEDDMSADPVSSPSASRGTTTDTNRTVDLVRAVGAPTCSPS